jgi:hypothetical protein
VVHVPSPRFSQSTPKKPSLQSHLAWLLVMTHTPLSEHDLPSHVARATLQSDPARGKTKYTRLECAG